MATFCNWPCMFIIQFQYYPFIYILIFEISPSPILYSLFFVQCWMLCSLIYEDHVQFYLSQILSTICSLSNQPFSNLFLHFSQVYAECFFSIWHFRFCFKVKVLLQNSHLISSHWMTCIWTSETLVNVFPHLEQVHLSPSASVLLTDCFEVLPV